MDLRMLNYGYKIFIENINLQHEAKIIEFIKLH